MCWHLPYPKYPHRHPFCRRKRVHIVSHTNLYKTPIDLDFQIKMTPPRRRTAPRELDPCMRAQICELHTSAHWGYRGGWLVYEVLGLYGGFCCRVYYYIRRAVRIHCLRVAGRIWGVPTHISWYCITNVTMISSS
jgi:hypothetical protein